MAVMLEWGYWSNKNVWCASIFDWCGATLFLLYCTFFVKWRFLLR